MPFPYNVFLLALLGAGVTAAIATPLWSRWCRRAGLMDDPGHRKLQTEPIALSGGLAVMTAILLPVLGGVALAALRHVAPNLLLDNVTSRLFAHGLDKEAVQLVCVFAGAFGILLIGFWDDKYELSPAVKFVGQVAVALTVAMAGIRITLFVPNPAFHYVITILWIVTVVNAFNFMDNMNGLCTGLGFIGAWYFAVISAVNGQFLVATTAFLIAGGLAGFLPYNFPKASAFLGDAGSHLTGYLLAVLAILPHFYTVRHPQRLAVLTPLLVLGVPLGDLAWVVVLRWRMGKPFYVGDNNHLSHRLTRRGLTRSQAVLVIWLLAATLGAVALVWQ